MNKFKDLLVWQKAVNIAVETNKLTKKFPSDERFGLVSQINRCSVSVPSNIAEGAGRNSVAEFHNFLSIATGSAFELETQILISERLGYIQKKECDLICEKILEVQNMLFGLQGHLKNKKSR